jgi:hypothetical protein
MTGNTAATFRRISHPPHTSHISHMREPPLRQPQSFSVIAASTAFSAGPGPASPVQGCYLSPQAEKGTQSCNPALNNGRLLAVMILWEQL